MPSTEENYKVFFFLTPDHQAKIILNYCLTVLFLHMTCFCGTEVHFVKKKGLLVVVRSIFFLIYVLVHSIKSLRNTVVQNYVSRYVMQDVIKSSRGHININLSKTCIHICECTQENTPKN